MTPFQALNPIGKLIFLSLCGPAVTLGLLCMVTFPIGMLMALCTAFSGTAAIINHLKGWHQWRPICEGVDAIQKIETRAWFQWGCDVATTSLPVGLSDVARILFYGLAPVFGFGAIALLSFFVTAVMFVTGAVLTRLGVSIADPSYFEALEIIRGNRRRTTPERN